MPRHLTMPYKGTARTIKAMEELSSGPRGAQSLELRLALEDVIRYVYPKDRLSLLAAVYYWFLPRFHFVHDPDGSEQVKDPLRALREIQTTGVFVGDCDCATTFLVACLRALGIPCSPMKVGFKDRVAGRDGPYTHVFCVAQDQHKRSIVLDPVAEEETRNMLGRVKQFRGGVRR